MELLLNSAETDARRTAWEAGAGSPSESNAHFFYRRRMLTPCSRPGCGQDTNAMNYERRIGYYELFNVKERQCDQVYPEDLEVAPLTHINLAFVLFDSSFKMIDTDGDLISRVTFLKSRYQGLRVNIAIGGWAFNDPPTQKLFSNSRYRCDASMILTNAQAVASSRVNRQVFIKSLVSFINKYGLE